MNLIVCMSCQENYIVSSDGDIHSCPKCGQCGYSPKEKFEGILAGLLLAE